MIGLSSLTNPVARDALEKTTARYAAMPPQRLKWFLGQLHLEQKIDRTEYAYWLDFFDIDPSL